MTRHRVGVRRAGPVEDATISGIKKNRRRKELYTSVSPELSAEDGDAFWQQADIAGEEAAGGTTPTPDQDQVDEYGRALGIKYGRTEPVGITKKKKLDSNSLDWEQAELKEKEKGGE